MLDTPARLLYFAEQVEIFCMFQVVSLSYHQYTNIILIKYIHNLSYSKCMYFQVCKYLEYVNFAVFGPQLVCTK